MANRFAERTQLNLSDVNKEVLKMLLLIVGIVFAESRDECIGWRQGEDGISNGISNEYYC